MGSIDWAKFKALGEKQLGKPYLYGAQADISCDDPVAFDCAELVYWLYGKFKIKLPNYSHAQYMASLPESNPCIGDLGFFKKGKANTHHVGIYWGDNVLEARGDPFNKVILRPRSKWEAWKDFTGWRRPIPIIKLERS